MARGVFTIAVLTLAVAFQAAPARAGWFSSHGGYDDCCPSCAAPAACCPPTCAAPMECYATAPTCCAPQYDACGEVYCDGSQQTCEEDCGLKRFGRRLWHLEQRKNRCLKETFCGWQKRGGHGGGDCTPLYYYQSGCSAPDGCY